ncbi:hypothetical protein IU449_16505 [Nocardia higoensis]|uniref:Lipoprotein n=1 Tax=Nocardia higoensis TaxID=228599 RepID=A0ABS0DCB9_9NOCA|nr:hypothetical protein [Nocardia higoensis]MBF6356122.1 hypothetical protein [Nocardia higoensis]
MRISLFRPAVAAARSCAIRFSFAILLAALGWTIVASPGTANADAGSCDVKVHNVHQSKGSPGLMDVKGSLVCEGDVDRADVFIYFAKLEGSTWTKVDSSVVQRTVHHPTAGKKYTVMSQNGTPCVPGVYIGIAEGFLTVDGKTYKNYQNGYGPESRVEC